MLAFSLSNSSPVRSRSFWPCGPHLLLSSLTVKVTHIQPQPVYSLAPMCYFWGCSILFDLSATCGHIHIPEADIIHGGSMLPDTIQRMLAIVRSPQRIPSLTSLHPHLQVVLSTVRTMPQALHGDILSCISGGISGLPHGCSTFRRISLSPIS